MIEQFLTKTQEIYTVFIGKLPEIFYALVTLVLFYYLGKFISYIIKKSIRRVVKERNGLARLVSATVFLIIFIIGFVIALNILNLNQAVTSVLAGVGIAGIALGFAFQDIAANYISGVIIAFQKPFRQGDLLKTNNYLGKVENIDLRSTSLVTLDGLDVIIPNKDVLQNPITNYTRTDYRRVDFTVGVSYAEDLDRVKKITIKAVETVELRDKKRDIELLFDEFADSSINILVRFWITKATEFAYRSAKSDAILNIKRAYNKNDITIPFPIRTLDFGIKGGQTLSEMKFKK